MSEISPRLGLPYLQPAQAQKHVTHNEALQQLDTLVQLSLSGIGTITPPSLPQEGEAHVVGTGGTDAWDGQDARIATWSNGAWIFVTPAEGWLAWDAADALMRVLEGGAWVPLTAGTQTLEALGVGTTPDVANPLAVAGPASLFTHDGSDHRVKINKATSADTASVLFQSDWTGHAEMGLAGDTGFSIKVSPDGTSWTSALTLDASTGIAGGAAVQATPTDTTPGRLMRADYGYGPGNLLGAVSHSGGTPTGAVIEDNFPTGSANGFYVKHANGLLECWHMFDLSYTTSIRLSKTWAFPAAFAAGTVPIVSAEFDINDFASNVSGPLHYDVSPIRFSLVGDTSVVLNCYKHSSAPSFNSGDFSKIYVRAIGRWHNA